MTNVPSGGLTAYIPNRSGLVHDLIWGPTVSGKVNKVDELLAADRASRLTESWLVDTLNAHQTWMGKVARSEADARTMLAEALKFRGGLVVTISAASVVLRDYQIRAAVERLVNAGQVKLRLSVRSLDVHGFGGSDLIRDAAKDGNIIKAAHHG